MVVFTTEVCLLVSCSHFQMYMAHWNCFIFFSHGNSMDLKISGVFQVAIFLFNKVLDICEF